MPSVGTERAIDVATWNIENFPFAGVTTALVADLIASMNLDLVAVQEIENIAAFDELVARLRGYAGVLSSHTYGDGSYQKIGFIYRTDLLELDGGTLLFKQDSFEFPRPPLQIRVTVKESGTDFLAIALHLKAGQADEDRERRVAAMAQLEAHMRGNVDGTGDDEMMVLGDFNQTLLGSLSAEVYEPFTSAPGQYAIRTQELADAGTISHLSSNRLIDHVLTTSALADELAGGTTVIPPLDQQMSNYFADVSDHLPVVISMPLSP